MQTGVLQTIYKWLTVVLHVTFLTICVILVKGCPHGRKVREGKTSKKKGRK